MVSLMLLAGLTIGASLATQTSNVSVLLDPICQGRISPFQYGQFIEYLCNLVPGMWADKLCDGNFEGLSPYKFAFISQTDFREKPWYPSGDVDRGTYTLDHSDPVNGEACQKIAAEQGSPCTLGVSQDGLAVDPSEPCTLGIWLRTEGVSVVHVRLHEESKTLAACSFQTTTEWRKYSATLTPSSLSTHCTITVEFGGSGTVWMDAASLIPKGTVGGWRRDVVEALRKLRPGIIRLGGSVMDDPNLGSFEWKDTIGDPDRRRPFRAWGGLQPTGPGIEEFVQLCKAVDAEPLICIRYREKSPKDAADEVQYFNGDASTPMGALRAKNGHMEPYHVKYWQVGNERSGPEYEKALPEFCKAIRDTDPTAKILSSFPTDAVLKGAGDIIDYTCPHQYDCANLQEELDELNDVRRMIAQDAPGRQIRVGVTEWNTTAGDMGLRRATLWNLQNALYCSRYQNLIHRNCDLVEIANRSNLTNSFCSGILQTDSYRLYLTPTYYAQMLYSNYAGTIPLKIDPPAPIGPGLDISATLSEDGNVLTAFAVNNSPDSVSRTLTLPSGKNWQQDVRIWTLEDTRHAGDPSATNSFSDPKRIVPVESKGSFHGSGFQRAFAPYSLTVLQFKAG